MSPSVVIVGGGAGGSAVARTVASKVPSASITLINPLPFLVARPTLPRMTVSSDNDLLDTALIPYDKLFKGSNGKFVQGVVASIREADKVVVLADGQEVKYDYLVLAPGSIWEGPLEIPFDGAKEFIEAQRATFAKAQKIVLVGGGAVGIEFAGELKDSFPKTEVTIVHGADALVNETYPARFRKSLDKSLHARGVNIILNDFVDEFPADGQPVKTRKGNVIDADLVVATKGPRPRTAFVAESLGEKVLDERGQIIVEPTLQLPGHANIFALGDAIKWAEQKQVMKAMAHADIVAANLVSLLSGKTALKKYKGSSEFLVVTNGREGGRAYLGILWGIVLGDWFVRLVKARTLLISMTRGAMGY
ncbi:FAD/NAD(P)-binding domain-containing protein [Mycena chlorophos]|uniref:FAD/NAD(P)-binding domain-containing protein n=1 Tax=Mycena chlorophos TaxID=658473 RepID=A0A8H6T580_MYCCL|nr:FAD/NAD(P)-binding domain-containing protein [Mycena chlorophos]